jgi:hypothetical protein
LSLKHSYQGLVGFATTATVGPIFRHRGTFQTRTGRLATLVERRVDKHSLLLPTTHCNLIERERESEKETASVRVLHSEYTVLGYYR